MLPDLSVALLERQISGERIATITVGAGSAGFTYAYEISQGAAAPLLEVAT